MNRALYVADWINGWGTKNYGRVWKLDVAPDKSDLAALRGETQGLMQLNYAKQTADRLYTLLSHADMRIRLKAQFELVRRGNSDLGANPRWLHLHVRPNLRIRCFGDPLERRAA